jgi:uncharacterized protein (TIGR02145 family)
MAKNLAFNAGTGCWAYENNENNVETYGRLYNWETAKTACPSGWHLPTDDEWKQLEMAIGMSQNEADDFSWRGKSEGTKLKTTIGWKNNGNGSDEYGFSALPSGFRFPNGDFIDIGYNGYWWSATENYSVTAWTRNLLADTPTIVRDDHDKGSGYSVRCVKD